MTKDNPIRLIFNGNNSEYFLSKLPEVNNFDEIIEQVFNVEDEDFYKINKSALISFNQKYFNKKDTISQKAKKINFYAKIFSSNGSEHISVKKVGNYEQPEQLGNMVANILIQKGALRLAEGWDKAINEWNKK